MSIAELGNEITNEEYHSRPELSSTQVAAYLTDSIKWYHEYILKDWEKEPATPAMEFGTLVHSVIEHGFDNAKFVVKPDAMDFRTKAGQAWRDAMRAGGYRVLDKQEYRMLLTINSHIAASDCCRRWSTEGLKEVEHIWNDDDLGPCRCKFDVVCGSVFVDWKTTSKKTEKAFINEISDRFYDVRLALYRRGFRDKYKVDPQVHVVAIQSSGGFAVTPYELDDKWLDDAEARLLIAVDDMRRFDLNSVLNKKPKWIYQPRWSASFDVSGDE